MKHNKNTVRIFATSDIHGQIDGLDPKGFDICIIAGDLEPAIIGVDADEWIVATFVPWIERNPNTQFVVIPGNHDFFARNGSAIFDNVKNIHFLIDEQADVCGLKIYGTPWVPFINGSWMFEAEDEDELRERFFTIPTGLDILVTHSPPFMPNCTMDVSTQYGNKTRHFGSLALLEAVIRTKPSVLFCGHIHSGDHNAQVIESGGFKTIAFNVSRIDENYNIHYQPRKVAIKNGSVTYIECESKDFVQGSNIVL